MIDYQSFILFVFLKSIGINGRLAIQCYTKRYKNATIKGGHFPHQK